MLNLIMPILHVDGYEDIVKNGEESVKLNRSYPEHLY